MTHVADEAEEVSPIEAVRALVADLPFGAAIHDDDLRFVEINRQMCEIDGLERAQVIGRTLSELLPSLAAEVEPLMRRALADRVRVDAELPTGIRPGRPHQRFATTCYPLGDEGRFVAAIVRESTAELVERDFLAELQATATALAGSSSLAQAEERITEGAFVVPDTVATHVTVLDPETDRVRLLDFGDRGLKRGSADPGRHAPLLRPYDNGDWSSWSRPELLDEFGEPAWLDERTTRLHVGPFLRAGECIGTVAWEFSGVADPAGTDALIHIYASSAESALVAMERTELDRRLALAYQRSLLPESLGDAEGLSMAADYRSALDPDRAGGDWYDMVRRRDGGTVLIVGDVVGHGIHAAIAMGQVRALVRSAALELATPVEMLDRVDQHIGELSDRVMAAMTIAVVAPGNCRLAVAVAAQPPPVRRRPDGTTVTLDVSPAPFLGAGFDVADTTEIDVELEIGDTLVLFTDGLVEERAGEVDEAMEAVRRTVAAAVGDDVDDILKRIIGTLAPTDGNDDIVVLVARRDD